MVRSSRIARNQTASAPSVITMPFKDLSMICAKKSNKTLLTTTIKSSFRNEFNDFL